ncbi:MAG TPA: YceH family protein [Tepidisphaeraceae bacterium]|nr:YceH family protein [Tepidisphaeraceae bacterium]
MIQLTPNEARVLGVLIEKAFTTPEQYPLSVNALTAGSNQKSNRDPVLNLTEEAVYDAAETLRDKQLVVRVDQVGSRVHKYRHLAGEVFRCKAGELAVLAELLMRGPQTLGELRGRAGRMHPLATLEEVTVMLRGLREREEPMIQQIPPLPGSRAERYVQLLAPDAHAIGDGAAPGGAVDAGAAQGAGGAGGSGGAGARTAGAVVTSSAGGAGLADRVATLEQQVGALAAALQKLASSIGEPNPLEGAGIMSASPDEGVAVEGR